MIKANHMEIDVDQTKEYYSRSNLEICDCDDCQHYYQKVKNAYREVDQFLNQFGIDILKPHELMSYNDQQELIYFACQYIVFGECANDFEEVIGDVKFIPASSYPHTGIEEEHFVLEFGPIKLKK